MVPPQHEQDCAVPPKSTLFCPECEHCSRHDGDWRIVETNTDTRLLCPECETEITVRPTFPTRNAPPSPALYWQPLTDGVRIWLDWYRTAYRV